MYLRNGQVNAFGGTIYFAVDGTIGFCLKTGQHSIFFNYTFIFAYKIFFLFRIKDTGSDFLSVLLNFIANYDSKNENIPP